MNGGARTTGLCASCGAPIIWTLTENGKRMPVNAEPVDNGNLRLDKTRPVHSFVVHGSLFDLLVDDDDGLRYVSHFVTCPQASLWRGGQPRPATPGPRKYRTFHRSYG